MFVQRALFTLIAGPIALYLIYLGGLYYFLPITAILLAASVEYNGIARRLGCRPSLWILLLAVLALCLVAEFRPLNPRWQQGILLFSLLLAMGYALWLYEHNLSGTAAIDWLVLSGGILLLGWIGSHFFLIRSLEDGWRWATIAILANWTADTGAYLFGKRFGRRGLSPRLSPNKTIEGYVGGLFFSAAFTLTAAYLLDFPWLFALGLLFLGAAISPAGDLGISLLKRQAGIKDSGHLFPGHGGALDRIDSLIWAVALSYYWAVWVT